MVLLLADENFNNQIVRAVTVGLEIKEIILIAECSLEDEWERQVRFLPLRKTKVAIDWRSQC